MFFLAMLINYVTCEQEPAMNGKQVIVAVLEGRLEYIAHVRMPDLKSGRFSLPKRDHIICFISHAHTVF